MTDNMLTYQQFLAARHLSETLLMKHMEESPRTLIRLYGEPQVEEAFSKLAALLGYRVERIEPAAERTEQKLGA